MGEGFRLGSAVSGIVADVKHLQTTVSLQVGEEFPVVSGPNAGKTYTEAYGMGTFDWTRDSALTRKVMDLDVNFRYKLGKGLRVRLGYEYKSTYSSVFAIAVLEGCGAGIVGGMTGTLTDMMDYDLTTNTVLVNFNYMASKKLNMHLNLNHNDSLAEISDLQLDTSQVDFLPGNAKTALNYDDFGGISDYSKLDIKQTIAEFGFDYILSKCWTLNGAIFYYLFDDLAEYLYTDTTGKSYSFFLGVTWQN